MDLLASNLVHEVGTRNEARRGKPAILLEFNDEAYQLIGIDLSHSTLYRGAVLNLRGVVLHQREVMIDGSLGTEALKKLIELVKSLREELTAPLLGLGVGVPGVVNPNGVVLDAPNLGWHNLDVWSTLEEHFECHVVVANDANVAVFAEYTYGRGAEDMILVRIGVGVSAGILLDGTPVLGSRFAAGEIGHVTARTESDRLCVCGRKGCLETWLSAKRLKQDLESAIDEEQRTRVLAAAGRALGATLSPIVAALNTSEIVLSGPTRVLDGTLAQSVLQSIQDRAVTAIYGDLVLRMSALGDDIIIRGATAMVMSNLLDIT